MPLLKLWYPMIPNLWHDFFSMEIIVTFPYLSKFHQISMSHPSDASCGRMDEECPQRSWASGSTFWPRKPTSISWNPGFIADLKCWFHPNPMEANWYAKHLTPRGSKCKSGLVFQKNTRQGNWHTDLSVSHGFLWFIDGLPLQSSESTRDPLWFARLPYLSNAAAPRAVLWGTLAARPPRPSWPHFGRSESRAMPRMVRQRILAGER